MNCKYCTRRQFLKFITLTGAAGLCQMGRIPESFARKMPVLKINITARCLFAGVVVTGEKQKTLFNPYRKETNYQFLMNHECSGVGRGLETVMSGDADIGTICRHLTDAEKAAGLVETPLTEMAYAVVVHDKNPVRELTSDQVLKIFAGQIQNWKEVGGKDKDILIYRQECGASYDYFMDQAISAAGIEKNTDRLKRAVMSVEITDNQFEKIADLDMAITMAPRSFFDANTKPLMINGVLPSTASEENSGYPFLAALSLVSHKNASKAVRNYLAFMESARGKKLMKSGLDMNWLRQGF